MLSGFARVYVLLYLLSFITSNNLYCYRHSGCPACVCVCVSVRSFLPLRASISRNIGTYVFTAKGEKESGEGNKKKQKEEEKRQKAEERAKRQKRRLRKQMKKQEQLQPRQLLIQQEM